MSVESLDECEHRDTATEWFSKEQMHEHIHVLMPVKLSKSHGFWRERSFSWEPGSGSRKLTPFWLMS